MSFWDHMFDNEVRQRNDINALADRALDLHLQSSDELAQSTRRIERLELTVEALWEILKARLGATDPELALMVSRVDLADGREDGRMGPDRSKHAQCCEECGRPVSPKRDRCVYCHTAISRSGTPTEPKVVRMVTCSVCHQEVPERSTYFSENGIACAPCHSG